MSCCEEQAPNRPESVSLTSENALNQNSKKTRLASAADFTFEIKSNF